MQPLGKGTSPFHAAGVRRDNDQVTVKVLSDILQQHGCSEEVVNRNVEKSLNLIGVQVQANHPMSTGHGDQVGN